MSDIQLYHENIKLSEHTLKGVNNTAKFTACSLVESVQGEGVSMLSHQMTSS